MSPPVGWVIWGYVGDEILSSCLTVNTWISLVITTCSRSSWPYIINKNLQKVFKSIQISMWWTRSKMVLRDTSQVYAVCTRNKKYKNKPEVLALLLTGLSICHVIWFFRGRANRVKHLTYTDRPRYFWQTRGKILEEPWQLDRVTWIKKTCRLSQPKEANPRWRQTAANSKKGLEVWGLHVAFVGIAEHELTWTYYIFSKGCWNL